MKLEFPPLKKTVPLLSGGETIFLMGAMPPLNFPWTLGGTRGGTNFFKNFWGGSPPIPPLLRRENPVTLNRKKFSMFPNL